uniref:Uncharacterized protein LOC105038838 n=1 Tax=Elaeis guineensis var. tenera TaxID=51953 RepID=A0A6J0PET0_ELAGV|nr:uncharacterized protein LOC105038838 [Elaeis guineensis]
MSLHLELQNLRQKLDETVTSLLRRAKAVADELAASGNALKPTEFNLHVLRALCDDLQDAVPGRGGRDRFGRDRGRFGSPGGCGSQWCSFCNHNNHSNATCFYRPQQFYPYSPQPNANFSYSPYPNPNPSHHHPNPPLLPTPHPSTALTWYPDTGASHHVTPDIHSMSSYAEYTDPDQVRVGNASAPLKFFTSQRPQLPLCLSLPLHPFPLASASFSPSHALVLSSVHHTALDDLVGVKKYLCYSLRSSIPRRRRPSYCPRRPRHLSLSLCPFPLASTSLSPSYTLALSSIHPTTLGDLVGVKKHLCYSSASIPRPHRPSHCPRQPRQPQVVGLRPLLQGLRHLVRLQGLLKDLQSCNCGCVFSRRSDFGLKEWNVFIRPRSIGSPTTKHFWVFDSRTKNFKIGVSESQQKG